MQKSNFIIDEIYKERVKSREEAQQRKELGL